MADEPTDEYEPPFFLGFGSVAQLTDEPSGHRRSFPPGFALPRPPEPEPEPVYDCWAP